jgi:hypothetical protein
MMAAVGAYTWPPSSGRRRTGAGDSGICRSSGGRAVEVGQRDQVDPGHFRGLPDQSASRAAPHHHGSDEEAGPRGVVIQSAQDIAGLGRHAGFLAQFPQRGGPGGLAGLAASAGQRPLPGVVRRPVARLVISRQGMSWRRRTHTATAAARRSGRVMPMRRKEASLAAS